jgi:hypothetical protein
MTRERATPVHMGATLHTYGTRNTPHMGMEANENAKIMIVVQPTILRSGLGIHNQSTGTHVYSLAFSSLGALLVAPFFIAVLELQATILSEVLGPPLEPVG